MPGQGPGPALSIDPPADGAAESSAPTSAWGGPDVPDTSDGSDVLWSFTEPPDGLEWLSGLAAFDHDRVRVELVDADAGTAPRDVTLKRFPTWGDAADLVDVLDVRPESLPIRGLLSFDPARATVVHDLPPGGAV